VYSDEFARKKRSCYSILFKESSEIARVTDSSRYGQDVKEPS